MSDKVNNNKNNTTNLIRPTDGRIIIINTRNEKVFIMMAWFSADFVQWDRKRSEAVTIIGNKHAVNINNNGERNSVYLNWKTKEN